MREIKFHSKMLVDLTTSHIYFSNWYTLTSNDPNIKYELTSAQAHQPESEHNNWLIKERMRAVIHRLPFQAIPHVMMGYRLLKLLTIWISFHLTMEFLHISAPGRLSSAIIWIMWNIALFQCSLMCRRLKIDPLPRMRCNQGRLMLFIYDPLREPSQATRSCFLERCSILHDPM
jgi:hypothetical protein